jgi:hypothetical protein
MIVRGNRQIPLTFCFSFTTTKKKNKEKNVDNCGKILYIHILSETNIKFSILGKLM